MPQRLLAIVTDTVQGAESVEEICRGDCEGVEVRLVMPAVEESPLRHTLGDVDGPVRDARERLALSLAELQRRGVRATGTVGDADPVLAAQDALREGPADEVVILEHGGDRARWFEDGLFERAREELPPPLRMVVVSAGDAGGAHVLAVESADRDGRPDRAEKELAISGYDGLPNFSPADLAGIVAGVVGTIVAIILAAAGPGPESAWGAASILIAMGIALINMAHVVGMTLFESVRYRGPWETFFHDLALFGTPAAVLANLLILLLS